MLHPYPGDVYVTGFGSAAALADGGGDSGDSADPAESGGTADSGDSGNESKDTGATEPAGCGCASGPAPAWLGLLVVPILLRRGRRR